MRPQKADPNTVGYVVSGYYSGSFISRCIWGYYAPLYGIYILSQEFLTERARSLTFTQQKRTTQACL